MGAGCPHGVGSEPARQDREQSGIKGAGAQGEQEPLSPGTPRAGGAGPAPLAGTVPSPARVPPGTPRCARRAELCPGLALPAAPGNVRSCSKFFERAALEPKPALSNASGAGRARRAGLANHPRRIRRAVYLLCMHSS